MGIKLVETKEGIVNHFVLHHDAIVGRYKGEDFLIVHNWKEVNELFEKHGINLDDVIEWGFSDEFAMCDLCENIVHLYPDYIGDPPDYWINKKTGEIICSDCVKDDPESYINYLTNNFRSCNFILPVETLQKFGFKKYNKCFNTSYDNPKEVMKELRKDYEQVIFNAISEGMFEVDYEAWVKEE